MSTRDWSKLIASFAIAYGVIALVIFFFNATGLAPTFRSALVGKPLLISSTSLLRLSWFFSSSILSLALFLVWRKMGKEDSFFVNELLGVYSLHMAISAVWPFTLATMPFVFSSFIYALVLVSALVFAFFLKQKSQLAFYLVLFVFVWRIIGYIQLFILVEANLKNFSVF